MTLHSPQVHGFFSIPVDHLHALRELAQHFRQYDFVKRRRRLARPWQCQAGGAICAVIGHDRGGGRQTTLQRRPRQDRLDYRRRGRSRCHRPGRRNRQRGSTVLELLERLRELKVKSIRIACTHGLFSAGALQRLSAQPDVSEIVCTNTVPIAVNSRVAKLTVLSIAPALAGSDPSHSRRPVRELPCSARISRHAPNRCVQAAGSIRSDPSAGRASLEHNHPHGTRTRFEPSMRISIGHPHGPQVSSPGDATGIYRSWTFRLGAQGWRAEMLGHVHAERPQDCPSDRIRLMRWLISATIGVLLGLAPPAMAAQTPLREAGRRPQPSARAKPTMTWWDIGCRLPARASRSGPRTASFSLAGRLRTDPA